MAGGGRKGNPFERWVCAELSRWWTGGARTDVFYRTGGSGGRATRRGRRGQSTVNHCGDVQASDPAGMPLIKLCAIELKRGYNADTVHNVLDAPPPKKGQDPACPAYLEWFAQAEESARHAGSVGWAVIARRDNRRAVVFLSGAVVEALLAPDGAFLPPMRLALTVPHGPSVVGVRLDDFLKTFTPEDVKRAAGDVK